ncbi:MAG: hypothetical protein M1835_003303 [Candelina submexicana]|nr:MAG: hypothetical protein M1835_003303 [Candelina submexicana]
MPHTRAYLKAKHSMSIATDLNQSTSGTLTGNGPTGSLQPSSDTAGPHKLIFGELNINNLEGSSSYHNYDNSFPSESTTDKMTSAEGSISFPDHNNQEREHPDESLNNATASTENMGTFNIQQSVEQYHLEASIQNIQSGESIIDELQMEAEAAAGQDVDPERKLGSTDGGVETPLKRKFTIDSDVGQCDTGAAEVSRACNEGGSQDEKTILS